MTRRAAVLVATFASCVGRKGRRVCLVEGVLGQKSSGGVFETRTSGDKTGPAL